MQQQNFLVYIAWGTHIPLAEKSARSFMNHNRELIHECILMIPDIKGPDNSEHYSKDESSPFTDIQLVTSTAGWHLKKPQILRQFLKEKHASSGFCLFVDNDTICHKPLHSFLDISKRFPVAAAIAPHYKLDSYAGSHIPKVFPEFFKHAQGLTCYNTGVILLQLKSQDVQALINKWCAFSERGSVVDQHDQGYFSLACYALGISPYPLIPNFNHRSRGPCFGEVYIHHSYNELHPRKTLIYPGLLYNDSPNAPPISMTFLQDIRVIFVLRILEVIYNRFGLKKKNR